MTATRRAVIALAVVLATGSAAGASPNRWETLPEPAALPEPTATGDVPVDDVTIHYATFGDAKHPAVVLLHGGLGSAEQFGNQVPALAEHHFVVAIDSRGQGRSTRSKHPLGYHVMAEDVIAVLDALKLDRAAVVGWSDGGVIGLDLAIHHADRLSRLFVIGTNYDLTGMRHAGTSKTFTAYFKRAKAAYKKLAPAPRQLAAVQKQLRAMWKSEPTYSEDQLRAITTPTTVALGDHDEIIARDHVEKLVELITGAKLAILPDVSHFAMWQDPDGFNQAVISFIDAK